MAQHVTLLVFCIGVFTLFNMYLRMIIFTFFVDSCIAIHIMWNISTMKICLYTFFSRFQLAIDIPAFSFHWFCRQFFK